MSNNFSNLNTAFNTFFGVFGSALTIFSFFIITDSSLNRTVFWVFVSIYLFLFLLYLLVYKPVRLNLGVASKYEKLLHKLEVILKNSHKNKLPVTILCKDYSEYKQISFNLSKHARNTLIWTLYGSPIEVNGWNDKTYVTDTDKTFASFKSKKKIRLVVFKDKNDIENYSELPDTSKEGRRKDKFKDNIVKNNGTLLLSYKDGICQYLGCDKAKISLCKIHKTIDFEFGFVHPTSISLGKRLCTWLIYLFNQSKYDEAKKQLVQEVSFGFETGYKTGVKNSNKHKNHVTFYPFGFELQELKNNGYEDNPNFNIKYENLYNDIECQINLIKKLTNNNHENDYSINISEITNESKFILQYKTS